MSPTDPAVTVPKRLMTVDEFWEFVNRPENENRWFELRKGEVVEMPRPTRTRWPLASGRTGGASPPRPGRGPHRPARLAAVRRSPAPECCQATSTG